MPFQKQKILVLLNDELVANMVTGAFGASGDAYSVQVAGNRSEATEVLGSSHDCWLVLQCPPEERDSRGFLSSLPLGPRHCVLLLIEPGDEYLAFQVQSPARIVPVTVAEANLRRVPELLKLAFKEVEIPPRSDFTEVLSFLGQGAQRKNPYLGKAIERIGCGIVVTNPRQHDNPIVYCNDDFLAITGYEEAEVLGRNCRFLQCKDESPDAKQVLRNAISKGHSCAVVLRNQRKNGEQYWNELTIAPVFDKGELTYFFGVMNDVTSRRGLEEDLVISSRRLKLAIEASQAGTWYRNAITDKLFLDVRAAQIFCIDWEVAKHGVSKEVMFGLIHEDDMPIVQSLMKELEQPTTTFSHEIRILTPHGYNWVFSAGVVECNAQREVIATRGICMDITDRKTNLLRIRELESQLQHMNRITSMSEMVTVLAHELSQPLMAISSAAGTIQADSVKGVTSWDVFSEASKDIATQVQRAGSIVNSLRQYVGNSSPTATLSSVNKTINDVVQFVSGQIKSSQVTIDLDLEQSLPDLYFDELQISQVLINLIQNAIDAMQDESISLRNLRIETSKVDGKLECRVRDTGPGVPSEFAQRQFEPFVTTKESGLGMGLRICETIVNNHGGQLEFKPNQPSGAMFSFNLPIADA